MERPVGILGGMGPAATVDLFEKIVSNTSVKTDQEHIPISIYNNPKVPSRIEAVLKGGKSPIDELIRSAKELEKMNVEFIVMPCHTAHFWIDELQANISTPIISMVENTLELLISDSKYVGNKVLLLASPATVEAKIYEDKFYTKNIDLVIPTKDEQQVITNLILNVKKGLMPPTEDLEKLTPILNKYEEEGVVGLIGGCTEIPLIFPYIDNHMVKIDPTLQLAKKVIDLKKESNSIIHV
ncbi:aspartate/glutamate racemase family protein [Alkalibacillus haloalkaliphilus]|uniref:aspartate/glutamate racemase family protein n=1 Tax=Alkalibacillus haloalkaliphilus TaxID=94136 RepID=UPI002935731A|nr:amino acid racemase [Alkalibacillus haloalkaliphilus]MDV2582147.1 amino acid racemase [Alkalibacillus haloalkaliphilus]